MGRPRHDGAVRLVSLSRSLSRPDLPSPCQHQLSRHPHRLFRPLRPAATSTWITRGGRLCNCQQDRTCKRSFPSFRSFNLEPAAD
jgi:hypothetical protein